MNLLLKNKIYRFITYSDILSVIGDSFFYLAFLTYASTLENSAIAISIISISESLPEVFSMFTGVYADKVKDKAKADIYSNFLRMFIYFFVAISFLIFEISFARFLYSLLKVLSLLFSSKSISFECSSKYKSSSKEFLYFIRPFLSVLCFLFKSFKRLNFSCKIIKLSSSI